MPFTLAHPAAILPFARFLRTPYALSALAAGSMAPDFEYFFRLRAVSEIGHTWFGLFIFCLPVGLMIVFVFHLVVKRPVLFLLFSWLRSRLSVAACAQPRISFSQFVVLSGLVVFGASTHLVWDSFSHQNGWAVRHIAVLNQTLVTLAGIDIHVYKLLQHGSTVVGLAVVAYALLRWLRRQPVRETPTPFSMRTQLAVVGMITVVPLFAGIATGLRAAHEVQAHWLGVLVVRTVIVAISCFIAGILVYSILHNWVSVRHFGFNDRHTR